MQVGQCHFVGAERASVGPFAVTTLFVQKPEARDCGSHNDPYVYWNFYD